MKKIFITVEDYQIISTILRSFRHEALVFGSRIKGTHQKFSDLDICLKSDKPIELSDLGTLKIAFSESDLPFSVDLIDYNDISDSFKKIIDTEAANFNDTVPAL